MTLPCGRRSYRLNAAAHADTATSARYQRLSVGQAVLGISRVAGHMVLADSGGAPGLAYLAAQGSQPGPHQVPESPAQHTARSVPARDMTVELPASLLRTPRPRVRWSEPLGGGVLQDFHRRSSRREPMIPLIRSRPLAAGRRYAMGWWYLDWLPSYVLRQPAGFGVPGNTQGLPYVNATGMAEERVPATYRVEPSWPMVPIDLDAGVFMPDMVLAGKGHYIEGRHLFTLESCQEAVRFGDSRYGAGNFDVYRIDSKDMPAVRYRRHVATCQSLAGPQAASDWPDPAARRGDVYLDISTLTRSHIRQVVAGHRPAVRASV